MTIDQLKAIAADPCINLSGLLKDADVSRSTFDQYVKGTRGKYGIKKEVAEKLSCTIEHLIARCEVYVELEPNHSQKHLDLKNDRIVPWRLKQIGFEQQRNGDYSFEEDSLELFVSWEESGNSVVMISSNLTELPNVKTFTDLKQLIKFLK